MEDQGRIVPGGKLEIDANSLESTVGSAQQQAQAAQPIITGALPSDPKYLNEILMNYLNCLGKDIEIDSANSSALKMSWQLTLKNKIGTPELEKVINALGHSFFQITDLTFNEDPRTGQSSSAYFLKGKLSLNRHIPLGALKKGIAHLVGDDCADYFIQEFGDVIGATDETKTIDTTQESIKIFLPELAKLEDIGGEYFIPRDPFFLLLTLPLEEREKMLFFFNKAREKNILPYDKGMVTGFSTLIGKSLCQPQHYCFSAGYMQGITQNDTIIPFYKLLEIGHENKIRGIKKYVSMLTEFNKKLKRIEYK